jgi:heptosyltransferase II
MFRPDLYPLEASPRWILAEGARTTAPPRRVLVHQSRFRVGDALWLTPLLRAMRRAFPGTSITVVAGPLAEPVLARCPHVSELLVWDPAGGEGERARVLAELSKRGFDAALFALVRRDKSRWLAEAVAAAGVPWRVNLEYLDGAEDGGREPDGLFTHEAWFVWGRKPSPELLLHALEPWLGAGEWLADRRVELPVSAAERRDAARFLEEAGLEEGGFTVLAPAGHSSERWPPERFAEFAVEWAAEAEQALLIEGAPADEPLLRDVERHIARRSAGLCRPWVATHPLGVLAALLERACLLVSNDSAPIHVAEAAGAPTLYFAQREKLIHSRPAGAACWALSDERDNRLAEISAGEALAAAREMERRGLLRRGERLRRPERRGIYEPLKSL